MEDPVEKDVNLPIRTGCFSLYLTNQKLKLPMEVMLFDQYTIPAKFGTNWPGNSRGGMFYNFSF
jgi:hypothetical protein